MSNESEREAFEADHKKLHPQVEIRMQNLVGTYTDQYVDHAAFWFQAGAAYQRTQAQPADALVECLETIALESTDEQARCCAHHYLATYRAAQEKPHD